MAQYDWDSPKFVAHAPQQGKARNAYGADALAAVVAALRTQQRKVLGEIERAECLPAGSGAWSRAARELNVLRHYAAGSGMDEYEIWAAPPEGEWVAKHRVAIDAALAPFVEIEDQLATKVAAEAVERERIWAENARKLELERAQKNAKWEARQRAKALAQERAPERTVTGKVEYCRKVFGVWADGKFVSCDALTGYDRGNTVTLIVKGDSVRLAV